MTSFLTDLGFEHRFDFVATGQIFVRGRVKAIVSLINEVTQSIVSSNPVDGCFTDIVPEKWRPLAPHVWLVEVSVVGSPADESLHEELLEFMDLLRPLVTPGQVDHAMLMCQN
ncbi:unnamed protein product [Protopolystoma xenopodis]|uniref:Mediator complex subunit 18 n=1 Tax=Protopolystoma xenopodis TaxID=117903 RepID=A0A3S5FG35_9PLAT|nr:unnamed protein product [Protopolystoma xenopodis]